MAQYQDRATTTTKRPGLGCCMLLVVCAACCCLLLVMVMVTKRRAALLHAITNADHFKEIVEQRTKNGERWPETGECGWWAGVANNVIVLQLPCQETGGRVPWVDYVEQLLKDKQRDK